MATIWGNTKQESTKKEGNNTLTDSTLTSWSRQQKLAMVAGFAILGGLLAVGACSKQSSKSAVAGVSSPASNAPVASAPWTPAPETAAVKVETNTVVKKAKKRPANVTYRDANSGLSFVYPRKYHLATGDKAQPQIYSEGVPMDFVNDGGETIATVAMPKKLYAGTDFESGFFSVNVNRNLSAEECSRFAFVETRRADDDPVSPEKVKVGETDMDMTDEFGGDAIKQAEARYYHNFENGACYEYVLGLGTAGYGLKDGIKPVSRDEVFDRLEKILASVKLNSGTTETVAKEQVSQPTAQTQAAQTQTAQPQTAQTPTSEPPAVAAAADANKTADATKTADAADATKAPEPDKK